jgi:hypothetical protein
MWCFAWFLIFGHPVALNTVADEKCQMGERWAMKNRKLWYAIALSTIFLVAARMAMAQEQAPLPEAQGQAPLPDNGNPDQGPPPYGPDQQQGQYGTGQEQGPPPGAARVGIINGQVSLMRGDSGEWVAAIVNAPVMQGDTVATAANSRTEVQLDFANMMRLDQNAQVKIAALVQGRIQIQVANGTVDYTVFKGSEANVEIDTPNMAVIPQGPGVYRIQIDGDSQTEVTVRKGTVQVSTPQGSTNVEAGQVIYVRGMENPEYQVANARPFDEFDRWNEQRDRTIEQAQSWQYTNRYYAGAQDLDQYGTWQDNPDYGNVWSPNVGPDWSPYSDGNWTWEPYWGWTWVGYEPWGWAPYHYGRWFWGGGRWCWWPGIGLGVRPLWAPAYVSFLGLGRGIGIGLGLGFRSIGWLALGPFDAMFGWWGHHNGYSAVGIGSIGHINNYGGGLARSGNGRSMSNLQAAFTNPNVRRGITTMPSSQFGRGLPAREFGRGVDAATLRSAQMVRGSLPVVPTRASLMPGNRMASRSAIPSRSINSTHFFSRNPVSTRTQSFNQRAGQNQQMIRQGPTGAANNGARSANSTERYGNAAGGGYGSTNRSGFANPRPATPRGQSGNPGWQQFSSRAPYSQGGQARSYNNGGYGTMRSQPAPRSAAPGWGQWSGARSYGGYSGRPTLNMNRPIVVPRSNAPRSYSGGGRGSAPSGGGRVNSGGGEKGGGGGGGHISSGGGGHSGGGGGHGGGGHR